MTPSFAPFAPFALITRLVMPITTTLPRLKHALLFIAVSAGIAWASSLFSTESRAADAPKPVAKPALTVTTTQPSLSALPVTLAANGSVTAWQEALIGTEATGLRLTEVRANVGDVVRKGQVLARFSPAAPQADVAQARANLLEAQATAAEAVANADRARSLQTTGALSASQINQYVTLEKTALARVDALKSTLGSQQLRLGFAQVLAPDDGVISARSATVGAVLGNGAELFRMIRQGRLEWRAEVTSSELGRITVGMPARITLPGGQTTTGTVRMVAPTVDAQTRTGLVYVDLPPMRGTTGAPVQAATKQRLATSPAGAAGLALPDRRRSAPSGGSESHKVGSVGAALPGMFAKGEFDFGSSNALTVPQQAVVVRDGFSYIFELGADQRVAQRKVQVGRRVGERIEVMGVAPSATLVASGAGFLNDGDLVKVVPPSSAPAALAGVPAANSASKPALVQANTASAAIK